MPKFCVNKNAQRTEEKEHEIHDLASQKKCLPDLKNQVFLGDFTSCKGAMIEAKRRFPDNKFDGCKFCCPDCHKI